ncbi:MAG: hypothetical protein AAF488_10345 [Planctomycetota bacterium]
MKIGLRLRRETKRASAIAALFASIAFAPAALQSQELVEALIFGNRPLVCETPNEPGRIYDVVLHDNPTNLAYDAGRGWGYEEIWSLDPLDPNFTPYGERAGYGVFGPFDDSPNGRTQFPDTCPSEIYDSFIGAKNFLTQCDEIIVGDRETACSDAGVDPDGIIFRIDVPNGKYRFVAAVGSSDNRHASRIVAENGGEGPPVEISEDFVVLVNNFDQAQHCPGVFARVGFGCSFPPEAAIGGFVNMDDEGFETDLAPASPVLEVTEGYIRIHQLQGNSNTWDPVLDGEGCGARDPNGGNMVLLELWRVDEAGENAEGVVVNVEHSFDPEPYAPGDEIAVTLTYSGADTPTTIEESVPEGWTVVDNGGGTVDGNVITFADVNGDGTINFTVQTPQFNCTASTFNTQITPSGDFGCPTTASASLACSPPTCAMRATGVPSEMLIIGPIALQAQAGPACDDNGNLGNVSYLSDGKVDETNILVAEDDEVVPDFGGESAGAGVREAFNFFINPGFLDGILNVWKAETDEQGLINYNLATNIGDPVDDYIVYSLTYLNNVSDECRDTVLEVGSDDAVIVYVNGKVVHLERVCRGTQGYGLGTRVPVTLSPGVNVVMIGVVERGGGTGVRLVIRDTDDQPIVDGSVTTSCDPPAEYPPFPGVTRAVNPTAEFAGGEATVTLTAVDVGGATLTVVETIPEGLTIADAGGGTVNGNEITFEITEDGETTYLLELPGACPVDPYVITGVLTADAGCASLGGAGTLICRAPEFCDPDPKAADAELEIALVFGGNDFSLAECETFNGDGVYESVTQTDAISVAYDAGRGWGYEELYSLDPAAPNFTPYGDRAGYGVFGPFDDSPNFRNNFLADEFGCGEFLYDSFIGLKTFLTPCDELLVGNTEDACPEPEGVIFRVDLPNGLYRFVAAVGDPDFPHTHRVVVENGGEGPPEEITDDHVVIVNNFDQAQQASGGDAVANCPGCSLFARVGFDDKIPPLGDGIPPSPQFVNMDQDGRATADCADSPILEVTEGYIRIHQLQGNSNPGPGRPSGPDANGGDLIIFEAWRVDGDGPPPVGTSFVRGDPDASGATNITDGIFLLNFLVLGGPAPSCEAAGDADASGAINITDGIFVLNFLFLGGPNPPAPYPDCGAIEGAECAAFAACP